jgi:hypothetical protein
MGGIDPMKNHAPALAAPIFATVLATFGIPVGATTYYVATSGSDANAGTLAKPFATLQKGHDMAVAGDTVYIRGGTYQPVTPAVALGGIAISNSGKPGKPIRYLAYGTERPVFDFSKLAISTTDYTHGFYVTGSYLYFRGFEICNVPMNTRSNTGMTVRKAARDTFERMDFHHNNGAGLFISAGTGGHLVLNSDSHDNYDPTSSQGDGQNADGFGVHYQETGDTTKFHGCRSWWNSDDGWDLISQEFPVLIEDSWAYACGYINSGASRPADGNGNGFKAGSSKTGIRHTVRRCVAWKNYASGFYANHSAGGNTWENNTAWQNGTAFNLLASSWDTAGNRTDGVVLTGDKVHILRNNIGYPNKNANMTGADTKNNTWDLGIVPTTSDFASVDDAGFSGARNADGSLPALSFLKLKSGSSLIDKGVDVGLPYTGKAPDLGAYEYGVTTEVFPRSATSRPVPPTNAVLYDLGGHRVEGRSSGVRIARWKGEDGTMLEATTLLP